MGGKAVNNVRSLKHDELNPTYEWVQQNILPLLGLNSNDVIPTGSFMKKPKNQTSGDIDIAINAKKYLDEGLEFDKISTAIDLILKESGFETTLLKGFDQVSVKVPINGNENNGYAQVDLMPSPDLKWARFIYHSPNLLEEESKYKGAVRNALLMALVSESTKEVTKLFEGQTEEYNSLAIRFPTGLWNIKRSFMGKKGIVKKGTILESEFITREPQYIIDIALGEGYKVDTANSFETLWEVIHRKDFIHKNRLNEIMSKFQSNLKSMMQNVPMEAIKKYPRISWEAQYGTFKLKTIETKEKSINEGVSDFLKPKSEEEIINAAKLLLKQVENLDFYKLKDLNNKGVLKLLSDKNELNINDIRNIILNKLTNENWFGGGIELFIRQNNWIKEYLTDEDLEHIIFNYNLKEFKQRNPDSPEPKNLKELRKMERQRIENERNKRISDLFNIIKGNIKSESIDKIIKERIKRNQFTYLIEVLNLYNNHKVSQYTNKYIRLIFELLDGQKDFVRRIEFIPSSKGEQWGLEFINKLSYLNIIEKFKKGNLQLLKANKNYIDKTYSLFDYDNLLQSFKDIFK